MVDEKGVKVSPENEDGGNDDIFDFLFTEEMSDEEQSSKDVEENIEISTKKPTIFRFETVDYTKVFSVIDVPPQWQMFFLFRKKHVRGLRNVFNRYDEDGDGLIDPTDLMEILLAAGITVNQYELVIARHAISPLTDEKIRFLEFLKLILVTLNELTREEHVEDDFEFLCDDVALWCGRTSENLAVKHFEKMAKLVKVDLHIDKIPYLIKLSKMQDPKGLTKEQFCKLSRNGRVFFSPRRI